MLQINYTAKRSLKAGHIIDDPFQIDVELSKRDRAFGPEGTQNVAMSGSTVSVIKRLDKIYSLQTQIVTITTVPDIDDMIEFLDSVSAGEVFQTDLDIAPGEDYILHSFKRPYTAIRIGTDEIYRFSFKVRKL